MFGFPFANFFLCSFLRVYVHLEEAISPTIHCINTGCHWRSVKNSSQPSSISTVIFMFVLFFLVVLWFMFQKTLHLHHQHIRLQFCIFIRLLPVLYVCFSFSLVQSLNLCLSFLDFIHLSPPNLYVETVHSVFLIPFSRSKSKPHPVYPLNRVRFWWEVIG